MGRDYLCRVHYHHLRLYLRRYKNLVKDFQTHHPQNFSGVPLVVETIYKRVWKTARKTGREDVLKKGIKISRFLLKFGIASAASCSLRFMSSSAEI